MSLDFSVFVQLLQNQCMSHESKMHQANLCLIKALQILGDKREKYLVVKSQTNSEISWLCESFCWTNLILVFVTALNILKGL